MALGGLAAVGVLVGVGGGVEAEPQPPSKTPISKSSAIPKMKGVLDQRRESDCRVFFPIEYYLLMMNAKRRRIGRPSG